MSVITAHHLAIGYKQGKRSRKVVRDALSFSLREGELTSLLGPNGAGKSTLLRTLSGAQKPLGGELMLDGRELSAYGDRERAQRIGLVLTDRTQGGGLSVYETVALGRHPHTGFFGRLSAADHRVVQRAMEQVGIVHKADSYVAELSDGIRQKVMIAKALAQECPILLLDEPTAFLDVVSRIEIMTLLHDLAHRQRKTVLLSTHDLEQALMLSDRLWLLSDDDRALQCGATEDLVLAGDIDRFFSRNGIVFDKMSGSFRSAGKQGRRVYVDAPDELAFWAKNAVIRSGYRPTTLREEAEFLLNIPSVAEIIWTHGASEQRFTSFSDLIAHIGRPSE